MTPPEYAEKYELFVFSPHSSALCYIPVLPPLKFYSTLLFQSHDLMSHGPSPGLSPDFHDWPYCSHPPIVL